MQILKQNIMKNEDSNKMWIKTKIFVMRLKRIYFGNKVF